MNPEKPAEIVDISEAQDADLSQEPGEEAEAAEELGNFFEAALQYEGQDADIVSDKELDVEANYDILTAMWCGEYMSIVPEVEMSTFGRNTSAKDIDIGALVKTYLGSDRFDSVTIELLCKCNEVPLSIEHLWHLHQQTTS